MSHSLNFTVGPAKLYPGVIDFYTQAFSDGWGEESHRSQRFTEMSYQTLSVLKSFFQIPTEYEIFYTYSATQALELCSKMLCKNKVTHVSNGNFGTMWAGLSEMEGRKVQKQESKEKIRNDIFSLSPEKETELICITANETSTGIAYSPKEIDRFKKKHPEPLLAIDITSSMGAVKYDFSCADAWVFSVQKAMGMPAGLGILILSPRAIQKAQNLIPRGGHHNIKNLKSKMDLKFQTPTTPNVLSIVVLKNLISELQNHFGNIDTLYKHTQEKANDLYQFFDCHAQFTPALTIENGRSESIIVIESDEESISQKYSDLLNQGITVGKGYGPGKSTQLRIGNFPVHTKEMMKTLIQKF